MSSPSPTTPSNLDRGLGLWQATSLNVANMVGIGPFITIPAFLATMHGPQALIGWVVAAVLVTCDGLVWSELGAALPGSGGTYHFLREIFGRYRWGRIMPFLFIWQFLVSGAMEIASGYVGAMRYVTYVFPALEPRLAEWHVPGGTSWIAAGGVLIVTLLLCQRIRHLGWLSLVMCGGTIVTVSAVIAVGLWHFDASLITFPMYAFDFSPRFAVGLGGAMTIAVYDYLGYFNVCHLGDEVREPQKTIPRAVMISIGLVALIYLTMNISIIAVVPWQEAMKSQNIAADFMERLFGRPVAVGFTWLILWTALASVFALTLGYSRIPFAAARRGDFFRPFSYLHPTRQYPLVSLAALGILTAGACFLPLDDIIAAAVCVRIAIQFIGQIAALHVVHTTRPDIKLPFRMWLYPLPSLVALVGWIFLLATANWIALAISGGAIVSGVVAFGIWTVSFRSRAE